MSRRYTTAQLNAISRSYTERARKQARADLIADYNIHYEQFARLHEYKGGPCRLLTDIKFGKKSTLQKVREYYEECKVKYIPQSLAL